MLLFQVCFPITWVKTVLGIKIFGKDFSAWIDFSSGYFF